jgi:hypothetical protein
VHILDGKQLTWAARSQPYFNLEMHEKNILIAYLNQNNKKNPNISLKHM